MSIVIVLGSLAPYASTAIIIISSMLYSGVERVDDNDNGNKGDEDESVNVDTHLPVQRMKLCLGAS